LAGRRPSICSAAGGARNGLPANARCAWAVCVLRGLSGRGGGYDNNVRLEPQAVGGEGGKPLALAFRGEVVDGDGLPIHIAQVAQALEERLKSRRPSLRLSNDTHGYSIEDEMGLMRDWLNARRIVPHCFQLDGAVLRLGFDSGDEAAAFADAFDGRVLSEADARATLQV
jgi:hypothetical protein